MQKKITEQVIKDDKTHGDKQAAIRQLKLASQPSMKTENTINVDGGHSKKELAKLAHGLEGMTFDNMGFPLKVEVPDPSKLRNI